MNDTPFRILVLGDFTGRKNRRLKEPLAGRQPVLVDLDNFDEVIADLRPTLRLGSETLKFRELDDFHPDHLVKNVEVFHKIADLRYEPPKPAATAAAAGPGLLDSILSEADDAPAPPVEEGGDLAEFIRKATAPYLEGRPDAAKETWAAKVAEVKADTMRAILHHPDFQALEAVWRAAWMLVHGLGDDVKISLLDARLDELAGINKLPGGSWSVVVGNYTFGETADDAARLAALGRASEAAGAPFVAEGLPPLEGAPPEWQELRRSPLARRIGLVVPRFLVRLPYGKSTSAIESFPFEEMKGSVHGENLWGNPAFCCAFLLGQSFREDGWSMQLGTHRRMEGMPLHVYKEDGADVAKPCAEVLLSEKDAEFLMEHGYMPLASLKGQDAVLLVRFQSIAEPLAALDGPWSE
jgi:type VI secretion system protein ImpC